MNRLHIVADPPPTDDQDDPLGAPKGIANGLAIVGLGIIAGVLIYRLWLAGPLWWLVLGVVGLALLSPWRRGQREQSTSTGSKDP